MALPILAFGGIAWGGGGFNGLTVSSGTFQAISTYGNDDGGNRQAIIVGNRTSSDTVTTDANGHMQVYVYNPTTGTITGTVAVTQSGAWSVNSGSTVYRTDGSATTQPVSGTFWQATQPISGSISNTSFIATQAIDSALGASVSIKGSSNTVSAAQSGTWTVQPGNTANSTAWLVDPSHAVDSSLNASVSIKGSSNTVTAVGNVANDGVDSGNPVKIGGIARTSYQTAVADADRVDMQADSEGKQVVMPYAIPALWTSGTTAAMTGTATTVLISSGGASINTYVTHLLCVNSHATVGTVILIRNGTSIKYTGYAVAAGGGFSVTLPTPLVGASNTQWSAENVTTGSNTYCDAVGFFAKN